MIPDQYLKQAYFLSLQAEVDEHKGRLVEAHINRVRARLNLDLVANPNINQYRYQAVTGEFFNGHPVTRQVYP